MAPIIDRQIRVDLQPDFSFSFQNKRQSSFSNLEEVQQFFLQKTQYDYDTVRLFQNGKKHYIHLVTGEVERYETKQSLRRTLSIEGEGVWVEECGESMRYFIKNRGWTGPKYLEVSKRECVHQENGLWKKVVAVAFGILAISPGIVTFSEKISISPETACLGMLALSQKSTLATACFALVDLPRLRPQAVSNEFQVNNFTVKDQINASGAQLKGGRIVMIWISDDQSGHTFEIYAKIFESSGELFRDEYRLNVNRLAPQYYPDITATEDGGFFVAWQSFMYQGELYDCYGASFDENGDPVGDWLQINSYTVQYQLDCFVKGLTNGDILTSWTSGSSWRWGQDGSLLGVYAQILSPNRTKIGDEFLVNTYIQDNQEKPTISALTDRFVVGWQSGFLTKSWYSTSPQDKSSYGVYGQFFLNNGTKINSEFRMNNYTERAQTSLKIDQLSPTKIVAVWSSYYQDGDLGTIVTRIFDETTSPLTDEIIVNSFTQLNQIDPDVGALLDEGFVIAWVSGLSSPIWTFWSTIPPDGEQYGIFAQRFDRDGNRVGGEFQVNDYWMLNQRNPKVISLSDGGWIIMWESDQQDGDGYGIFAKRYDAESNAIPMNLFGFQTTTVQTGSSQSSGNKIPTSVNDPTTSSIPQVAPSKITKITLSSSIIVDGNEVGSYFVSEDADGKVIFVNFDHYNPQDGDVIQLFTIPEGETGQWESIRIEGDLTNECLEMEAKVSGNKLDIVIVEGSGCNGNGGINSTPHPLITLLSSYLSNRSV